MTVIRSMPVSVTAPPQDPPVEKPVEKAAPEPEPEKKRHWVRWIVILAVMLMVISSAVAGTGYYLARKAVADIPTVDLQRNTLAHANQGDVQNFLILGSDSRMDVDKSYGGSKIGGERSDTIMVLQLDPRRDKGIVLSIPRDTKVDIPGHGSDKINAAYSDGGTQLAVETVKSFTGLPIHHYIEVNFEGFTQVVDAVGGVDICVDQPIRDEMTGLDLKTEGCHHLTGEFALAYARSREAQVYEDGKWKAETSGDFGRIQRQQNFMRALMKKAISINAVGRFSELSKAIRQGVKIDEGLNFDKLMEVYGKFSSMTPEKVEMLSVPGEPQNIKGVSYVIAKEPDTTNLFHSLGAQKDTSSTPGQLVDANGNLAPQIQVKILNGTQTMGLAAEAASKLKSKGFFVTGAGDTKSTATTEIKYEKGAEAQAQQVKTALGAGNLVESKTSLDGNVVVYLGRDFRG